MKKNNDSYDEQAAMDAAQLRSAEPPLRDILKREHDEAQKRPRNEALEIWGDALEGIVLRDLERRRKFFKSLENQTPAPPKRHEPDLEP